MRRYDDPVDVSRGRVAGIEGPEQFRWRGRRWQVRTVVAHWVETPPWWQSRRVQAALGTDDPVPGSGSDPGFDPGFDLVAERELWRVEAGRAPDRVGVFDLAFDWSNGRWQLVGCVD